MECYDCKHVKTRKPHTCFLCGRTIESGKEALYESGKYDGEFFSRYTCKDCKPLTDRFWEFVCGETYSLVEDFMEMLQEHIDIAKPSNHPLVVDIDCQECGKIKAVDWTYEVSNGADTMECPRCFREAKVIKDE